MRTPSENSQPDINPEAIKALKENEENILDKLAELNRKNSGNQALQDIIQLGGIGNFGFSLEGIIEFAEGARTKVSQSNARFAVSFLNSPSIQSFIVNQCEEKVTMMDLKLLQKALEEYL